MYRNVKCCVDGLAAMSALIEVFQSPRDEAALWSFSLKMAFSCIVLIFTRKLIERRQMKQSAVGGRILRFASMTPDFEILKFAHVDQKSLGYSTGEKAT